MEYGDDMTGSTMTPSADTCQEPAAPLQVSRHPAALILLHVLSIRDRSCRLRAVITISTAAAAFADCLKLHQPLPALLQPRCLMCMLRVKPSFWSLQVDIHELDNEIVLKADTPGMTGANVKVRVAATAHDSTSTESFGVLQRVLQP
jgi:hypothetical protein